MAEPVGLPGTGIGWKKAPGDNDPLKHSQVDNLETEISKTNKKYNCVNKKIINKNKTITEVALQTPIWDYITRFRNKRQ